MICFGQNVYEKLPITRSLGVFEVIFRFCFDFRSYFFQAVFGDVSKTEGATNLYPAVDLAVKRIQEYTKNLPKTAKKRVIAFTDGGGTLNYSVFGFHN